MIITHRLHKIRPRESLKRYKLPLLRLFVLYFWVLAVEKKKKIVLGNLKLFPRFVLVQYSVPLIMEATN